MISKSKIKLIKSLKYKKTREELNLFLVEGLKGIMEVNKSKYDIKFTVISKKTFNEQKNNLPKENVIILNENEIKELRSLNNNVVGFSVSPPKTLNQVSPPSSDFQSPFPIASPAVYDSPVPT